MFSSYRLTRIPQDDTLQPWNAADELLLARLPPSPSSSTLIINDSFGALAIALADLTPDWWNDSAMSEEALLVNCERNAKPVPKIIASQTDLATYDQIIIQIPKSVRLFQWQLQTALKQCPAHCKVYALGMVKHIGDGHINVMKKLFTSNQPGRAEKKARVIELTDYCAQPELLPTQYEVPELQTTLRNLPGCFAESKPDPGGRLFAQTFNQMPQADSILDLGCGNGLLSKAIQQLQPNAAITLVDESRQAIDSARLNLACDDNAGKLNFLHSNGLAKLGPEQRFDLILCNPPFHQENVVTETIARQMFRDAARFLRPEGELWIVANRNLDYYRHLKVLFKTVKTTSRNAKFTIFQCSYPH